MRPLQKSGWSRPTPVVDQHFIAGAIEWMRRYENAFIAHVWKGYDNLDEDRPHIDETDLERSITQELEGCIGRVMSGDEPYRIQHGSFERETKKPPPAQPPCYDLAFIFRHERRIMWPMEAKVLKTANALSDYIRDVKEQYLTCRYAPLSPSAGMLGYLLEGEASDALAGISAELKEILEPSAVFPHRACARSSHVRQVPEGKPYSDSFDCHHLILGFHGLRRWMR